MTGLRLDGKDYVIGGRLARTMRLRDAITESIADPEFVIRNCRERRIAADILQFAYPFEPDRPIRPYHTELENLAVIPVSTYEHWLARQVHPNTRNKVSKARRLGVEVRAEAFTRDVIEGMAGIFNETRVRRGRLYAYFGQSVESIEREWGGSDLARSTFLAAYVGSEMIGFIKLVFGDHCARTSGTVAKVSHRDKAPMNALIAQAVQACAARQVPFLVYGKFEYAPGREDSLTAFKLHNGFERLEYQAYYAPLTLRGGGALRTGLHHGFRGVLPARVRDSLIRARSWWYSR